MNVRIGTLLLHPSVFPVFHKSKKIWEGYGRSNSYEKPTQSAIAAATESFAFSKKNIQKELFFFLAASCRFCSQDRRRRLTQFYEPISFLPSFPPFLASLIRQGRKRGEKRKLKEKKMIRDRNAQYCTHCRLTYGDRRIPAIVIQLTTAWYIPDCNLHRLTFWHVSVTGANTQTHRCPSLRLLPPSIVPLLSFLFPSS